MGNFKEMDIPKIINGKYGEYHLNGEIGSGGNGKVFNITIDSNEEQLPVYPNGFVIKILCCSSKSNFDKRKERFYREIRIVQEIADGIDVIPIIDSSKETDKSHWYLMPKAKKYCRESPLKVIKKIVFIAENVKELHKRSVYHRDIKPSNVLMLNGKLCLADYGMAWFSEFDSHITDSDEAIGPISIRPPEFEYYREELLDDYLPFSDVYLLAKTLWIMLTKTWYGFSGQYLRSNTEIYLDRKKLNLGKTIEPLHMLMEESTKTDPLKRISLEKFINLLEEQIEIAEGRAEENKLNTYCFDEVRKEKINQLSSDINSYYEGEKILKILQDFSGCSTIRVNEYGKEIVIGEFKGISLVEDNYYELNIEVGKSIPGTPRKKILLVSINKTDLYMDKCVIHVKETKNEVSGYTKIKDAVNIISDRNKKVNLYNRSELILMPINSPGKMRRINIE